MVNKSIKLDYLDSLRGIAAFVVVIGHTNDSFKSDDKYLFEFFFNFLCNYTFFNGHYSVCVFFVLSGFVLSYSYFRNFDFDYVIKQSIKRFPRLLLPVLATSILYFFAKLLDIYYNVEVVNISNEPWFGKFWHEAYSLKQLFFRCIYDLFIFHDQGFLHNINFCLWTMPIELQFSFLLFSLLLFIKSSFRLFLVNILIFIFLIMFSNTHFIYFLGFLMGTNIAFLFVNYNDQLSKFNLIIFLIISLLIGVNFDKIFSMNTSSTTSSVFTIFMNLLGAFLLIVFTLSNVNIQNFLSNKYLKYLGKISFSMYLIHPLVLGTISSFLFVKLNNYLSQNTLFFVIFMTSLIFSIVAADIIYRLIDKPSIFIADSIYKIINEKILKRIIHD